VPIFTFLHVLTMFVAVAMAYGPAMLIVVASQRNDVVGLRGVMHTSDRLSRLVAPAFILGLVFGIVAIFVHQFDPLAGWLLIAYGLFAAMVLITAVFTSPWLKRVTAAADASPDDAPSAELLDLLNSPRNRALLALDALIVVALIADMVLKPLPGRVF
jgi:hypothetical protein